MANRHERRKAEAVLKKNTAMSERRAQLDEAALRMRRTSTVGSTVGEVPDYRGHEPQHSETK